MVGEMTNCLNGGEHKVIIRPPIFCSVCGEEVFSDFSKALIAQSKSHVAMVKELRELHEVIPGDEENGPWCHYCDEYLFNCEVHWILNKYEEKK